MGLLKKVRHLPSNYKMPLMKHWRSAIHGALNAIMAIIFSKNLLLRLSLWNVVSSAIPMKQICLLPMPIRASLPGPSMRVSAAIWASCKRLVRQLPNQLNKALCDMIQSFGLYRVLLCLIRRLTLRRIQSSFDTLFLAECRNFKLLFG